MLEAFLTHHTWYNPTALLAFTDADMVTVHDCVFKLGNYSNSTTASSSNASSTASGDDSAAFQAAGTPEEAAARALAARILTPRRREMVANAVRSRQEHEARQQAGPRSEGGGASLGVNGSSDLEGSVDVTQRLRSGIVHRLTRLERFPLVEVIIDDLQFNKIIYSS